MLAARLGPSRGNVCHELRSRRQHHPRHVVNHRTSNHRRRSMGAYRTVRMPRRELPTLIVLMLKCCIRLSMILSGLVRITSPSPASSSNKTTNNASYSLPSDSADTQESIAPGPQPRVAYLMPGTARSSLIIAADMKSTSFVTGHYTEFPTDEPTILVQIPFVDNKAPDHVVLYEGSCI
jgi:hypothetical protein